jgi:hypothetical protein
MDPEENQRTKNTPEVFVTRLLSQNDAQRHEHAVQASAKSRRSASARVGELVHIVEPKLFVRCGYPLTREDILLNRRDEVEKLMLAAKDAMALSDSEANDARVPQQLENLAVTAILVRERFGGSERAIFEENAPELKGAVARVLSKSVVVTGTYNRASGGYSYSTGEYDWEPAYIWPQRRHVIYDLGDVGRCFGVRIAASHCRKVEL